MAGRGSRLRPHTLTIPKPLLPVAGKPIVQRIVEDLSANCPEPVEEVAFIIGDFGEDVEQQLLNIAQQIGAKGSIYHQEEPQGPAHAIYCAAESLSGPCVVAFADTLFKANFSFETAGEAIIWVQKVENPSSFGVVKTDDNHFITDFVEKPKEFVSDKAIVGIYFFKDGGQLKDEIAYLINNDIRDKGEFQITSALENMKCKGVKFEASTIEEWLDCGNKDNVLKTNSRILQLKPAEAKVHESVVVKNSVIIPPCYIGENSQIINSIVGPFVSIGDNSSVTSSVILNSMIQNESTLRNANLDNSMIGNLVEYDGFRSAISLGDYSKHTS